MGLRARGGRSRGFGRRQAVSDADPRAFRLVVSYRRVDTGGDARSLAETLAERFGEDNVFFDIHGIAPGQPFDQVIAKAVEASDVFIACIGQHWLTVTAPDGSRRIDNPEDYVRRELEGALAADVLVIPVTFEGAQMPGPADLPDSLKPFTTRNAVDVRATRWHEDVNDFVGYLVELKRKKLRTGRSGLGAFFAGIVDWSWHSGGRRRGVVLTAAVLLLAVVLGGFGLRAVLHDSSPSASPGPTTTGGSTTAGTDTGAATTVPEPGPVSTLAYSAGSHIYFLAGKDSVPTQMPGDPLRNDPDWLMPHGTRLAYSEDGDIWTANPDGSETVQVTNGSADDGGPAWSPDGKWIAFTRGGSQIWIVDAQGKDAPRRFADGGAPDWSQDGKKLVYQRAFAIWVSDFPNATNERKLSEGYPPSLFPAWSPDGRRIAFILPNANGQAPSGCKIVIMKPNRRDPKLLDLKQPRNDQCRDVAWSADGRSLSYAGGDAGLFTLPRYTETAPKATQIADIPGAKSLSWSRP